MCKTKKVYHYDYRNIPDGETMLPFGGHYARLTREQKIVEDALIPP